MLTLHLDCETRSEIDLKDRGIDNYVKHPSTKMLMLAYAFDDGGVLLWEPHRNPEPPEDLMAALYNKDVVKRAWNVSFEYNIFRHVMKWPVRLNQFVDTMAHARYLALPAKLGPCCKVLNLPVDKAKDKSSTALIKTFSILTEPKATKKNPNPAAPYFKDENSHAEQWRQFGEYCKQDVVAERAAGHTLNGLGEFPESEYTAWILTEIINDRGYPVDMLYVNNALRIAAQVVAGYLEELTTLTGLDNPNSTDQLHGWLSERGYKDPSIDVKHVIDALEHDKLTLEARQALEIRQKMGGTSYKKLEAIQRLVSDDGRLRNAFVYHAAHTGRWSSRGMNFQNLYRPTGVYKNHIEEITEAIRSGTLLEKLGKQS